MIGADGDDIYFIDDAGDQVSEFTASGGIDTVNSNQANSTIGNNIENFNYTGNVASRSSAIPATTSSMPAMRRAARSKAKPAATSSMAAPAMTTCTAIHISAMSPASAASASVLGTLAHSGSANGSLASGAERCRTFLSGGRPQVGAASSPHVTVLATGGGVIDYYSVQINNFIRRSPPDIDFGFGTSNNFNGTPIFSAIKIYDPNGNEAGFGSGSDPTIRCRRQFNLYRRILSRPPLHDRSVEDRRIDLHRQLSGRRDLPGGQWRDLSAEHIGRRRTATYDDTLHGNGGDDVWSAVSATTCSTAASGTDTADYSEALQRSRLSSAARLLAPISVPTRWSR